MITANQLRIGNYVQDSRLNFRMIEAVVKDRVYLDGGIAQVLLEDINPVPLSPDILEKWCGFEETHFHSFWHERSKIMLTNINERFEFLYNLLADEPTVVTHLHQLQNLYFSLTGQELEITMPTEQKAINEP